MIVGATSRNSFPDNRLLVRWGRERRHELGALSDRSDALRSQAVGSVWRGRPLINWRRERGDVGSVREAQRGPANLVGGCFSVRAPRRSDIRAEDHADANGPLKGGVAFSRIATTGRKRSAFSAGLFGPSASQDRAVATASGHQDVPGDAQCLPDPYAVEACAPR